MKDVMDDVSRWFSQGRDVCMAQVVRTWGSSPRVVGSVAAISDDARIAGSVSGGCIEGEAIRLALECLDDGRSRMGCFHASTNAARRAGLSCGGDVDVLVSPLSREQFEVECGFIERDEEYLRVAVFASEAVVDEVPTGRGSVLLLARQDGRGKWRVAFEQGAPVSQTLCDQVLATAAGMAPSRGNAYVELPDGTCAYLVRRAPRPRLVCVGGVHIAIHLCRMAKALGWSTVVVDPRRVFGSEERFPDVDELVQQWPQEAFSHIPLTSATAVCALTHDPKIDVPALQAALDSPAFYIGSLGRLSTQRMRARQLRDAGAELADLDRIFGPIGLDLAGREPAEIALSIMAQITAIKHGSETLSGTTMLQAARAQDSRERKSA